jgi:hypothetical protein
MKKFYALLLSLFISGTLLSATKDGNQDWRFVSPKTSDIVKSGELFVLVNVDTALEVIPSSVQVYIDEVMVNLQVKVKNHKVSFLYLFALSNGKHSLELKGKTHKYGWLGGIITEFTVGIPSSGVVDESGAVLKRTDSKYGFTGSVSLDARVTSLSGSGAELRQESPFTSALNFYATARVKKVTFPMRLYVTSDEYNFEKGTQSRNSAMIGMQSRYVEAFAGDMNPIFDKLVLTGTRVTGASVNLMLRRMSLMVVHGYVNRALEGDSIPYHSGDGFLPPNLQVSENGKDSFYIKSGVYRRDVTAARLLFGSREEGSSLSFMVLKGKDVQNSIKYGLAPKENVVGGIENSFSTTNNKVRFSAGAAFSLYTDDVSRGILTEEELDSTFKRDMQIDPEKFKNIIKINSTSTPPGRSSAAYYAGIAIKDKIYSTAIDFRSTGSAYKSFGNPFARNDQMLAGLRQGLFFWKRRIMLNGQYQYQKNNLSKNQFSTIQTSLVNGGIIFAPGENIPTVNFSYNTLGRKSKPVKDGGIKPNYLGTNDLTNSLNGGITYDILGKRFIHHITLQGMMSKREDKLRPDNNTDTRNYVGGYGIQIKPVHLTLDMQGTRAEYVFPAGPKPMYDYYSGSLSYELEKYKLEIGAAAGITNYYATDYSTPSRRGIYNLNIGTEIVKNWNFYIEGGAAPFTDLGSPVNNYNETYFYGKVEYKFNRL